MLLQVGGMEDEEEKEKENGEWKPWIKKYPTVFGDIWSLLPQRSDDHKIPLLPGSGPMSMKAYRYPYYQKQEI